MADIFLSYAREDRDVARRVAHHLESRGWTVFWDARLRAGQDFAEILLQQLRQARCEVVLWSRASVASGWVRDEAGRGRDRHILVPVLIENVEVPLGFGHLHTESLVGWRGSAGDSRLQSITEAIEAIVPAPPPATELSLDAGSRELPERPAATPPRVTISPQLQRTRASATAAGFQDVLARHASDPKARARAIDEYCKAHGDPRFRADAWYLPAEPLLGFVEIPAGPFTMGSDRKKDPRADAAEQPAHELTVPGFYMARFPVTVAQFKAYVDESGTKPEASDWARGKANHPVVSVLWHEALAYCAWLTKRLQEWPGTPRALARVLDPKGKGVRPWQVTLPTEAEWEKAARGTDGRIYPWGAEADANKANYGETGIGETNAVGCFPGGASPFGVEDLSGNVWEWTRSLWGKDPEKPAFAYPYDPGDGREDVGAREEVLRVVRGGSFLSTDGYVRAAFRSWFRPRFRDWFIGFRVVVSPFFSEL
jgi:formylglycine-generating enzyme required for sulfatase activity